MVVPTSYSSDLRILIEGDVVNQSSFAFTIRRDEWKFIEEDGDERVERTVLEVEGLYDVTTCAMGAYPQTESEIAVRSLIAGRPRIVIPSKDSRTLDRGAERDHADPEPDPAPPEGEPAAADDAPDQEVVDPPAQQPDPAEGHPEDREAQEREFALWQQKRAAEHRRTREFAFGVTPMKEEQK
jgi:hypothetical protein